MKRWPLVSILLYCIALSCTDSVEKQPENWPAFRGTNAAGVSQSETPVTWDIKKGTNVKWKVPVPGLAHSCPVVWGDKIFLTTAVPEGEGSIDVLIGSYGSIEPVENKDIHEWWVYCLDKHTGTLLWKKSACKGIPKVKRHPKSSHANATPVTDGKHVVAFFGSEGLYCYSVEGVLLWQKDFGILNATYYKSPESQWGFGNSPIIHDGVIILQVDVLENSFIGAYDVQTGKELWRTPRTVVPTWCTPSIYTHNDSTRIAVNGFNRMGGYDFKTGKELWTMKGGGDIPVPAPLVTDDLLFFTSGHGKLRPIYAVKTGARGDISLEKGQRSNEYVAWSVRKKGAYMPTPIIIGDHLYRINDEGHFTCFKAATGKIVYSEKIKGSGWFIPSLVASENAIYCTVEEGEVYVLQKGDAFKILAKNTLRENCLSTPAIVDGIIYFRTQQHLIAIGERTPGDTDVNVSELSYEVENLLETYTGEYRISPERVLAITRDGERLYSRLAGDSRWQIFPMSKSKYHLKIADVQFTFNVDENGEVESLTLHEKEEDLLCKRIR